MRPIAAPASASSSPAPPPAPSSPWHSPVPYLFGGLAAMLGLIALALLILACSYWRLNDHLEHSSSSSGAGAGEDEGSKSPATFTDLVAVVMAGEKMPTFLAAPIVRRASNDDAAASAGEGSPEIAEEAGDEKSRGKAEVGGGERSQQQLALV